MKNFLSFFFLVTFLSCQFDEQEIVVDKNPIQNLNKIKYAKGFTITQHENYKLLTLTNAWVGEKTSFKYVLYNHEKPTGIENAVFIKTPIKSIACMSLTHVAFIEKLGLENSIIALSGCDYVSSTTINKRIANDFIFEIGQEKSINYEKLIDQHPDVIMGFGIDASSKSNINKMKSLGLEIVLNAEYMETHPLGKAEWIKFVAAFYNEDKQADVIFNKIEKEYLGLLKLTQKVTEKPTVFTGMPWGGIWYVPGSESFQVQFFKDAGVQYLWMDNKERSSIIKSKEIIIDEAFDADYWLNQNSYRDINSIVGFDKKFKNFKATKEKNLYNNDNRLNSSLGNDYWESGVINPHIILKDLIQIFHPNLIDHQLYYYRRLK
ncbi:MAG: hypothetical protein COA97_09460 [Flavobacteriales bacterium]|nr:MAG: hypothetical protein COA97_09460 [Flavobacteriales bacterium]